MDRSVEYKKSEGSYNFMIKHFKEIKRDHSIYSVLTLDCTFSIIISPTPHSIYRNKLHMVNYNNKIPEY